MSKVCGRGAVRHQGMAASESPYQSMDTRAPSARQRPKRLGVSRPAPTLQAPARSPPGSLDERRMRHPVCHRHATVGERRCDDPPVQVKPSMLDVSSRSATRPPIDPTLRRAWASDLLPSLQRMRRGARRTRSEARRGPRARPGATGRRRHPGWRERYRPAKGWMVSVAPRRPRSATINWCRLATSVARPASLWTMAAAPSDAIIS